MRIRDMLMVVVAVGGLIFGWLQDGSLRLQRGFVVTISDSDVLIHMYAKPVVADIHHNNKPVLLACPRADILAIYPTHYARRNFENVFVHMSPQTQVQLYSTIVGIAVGNISHTTPATTTTPASVQTSTIIAVVTDDYRLQVFDASLQSLWSSAIIPMQDAGIILHHAAVTVLPERVYEQDHGTVIVAVSVAGANGTEHQLVAAFAGDTGEMRWRHVTDPYVLGKDTKDANVTSDATAGLLLTPEALAERSAELHWTHFREAVISALPHLHDHVWDGAVKPHIFFHAKNRKKNDRQEQKSDGSVKYKDRRVKVAASDVGELGERVGAASRPPKASKKQRHPNTVVVHTKNALEVLHLYTGKRVTRVYPLKAHTTYHDVDDDFHIDAVSTTFGSHTATHGRHGADIVVDCLGVVTSGVPMAQDNMFNATICDTEGLFSGLSLVSTFLHSDHPDIGDRGSLDALSLIGSHNVAQQTTRGAAPVVVQHPIRKGRDLFKAQRHAVFLIDTGLATCVDPVSRTVVWRTQTDASFLEERSLTAEEVSMGLHSEDEKESRLHHHPHIAKYSLHQHDISVHSAKQRYRETDPFVLAVGSTSLAAINARSGVVATTVLLEQPPVAPTLVVDFNGDGVNDVIVFSANSIYGFVAQQQSSTSTIAMLMILMAGVLVTLAVAREMREQQEDEILPSVGPPQRQRKVKRSTD